MVLAASSCLYMYALFSVSGEWERGTSAAAPLQCYTLLQTSGDIDLCAKHSCKHVAMTLGLWSCKVKKEDKVGAGPQKMAVLISPFMRRRYNR